MARAERPGEGKAWPPSRWGGAEGGGRKICLCRSGRSSSEPRLGSPECQTLEQPGPFLWLRWGPGLDCSPGGRGRCLCRWALPGLVGLLHCPCPSGPLWEPEARAAGGEAGSQRGWGGVHPSPLPSGPVGGLSLSHGEGEARKAPLPMTFLHLSSSTGHQAHFRPVVSQHQGLASDPAQGPLRLQ